MILTELKQAVARLSPEERLQLRDYINQCETAQPEKLDLDALEQIFAELREGFSDKDLDDLEWAMNVEYIEPLDESPWQD